MRNERRDIIFDHDLRIEAYCFEGLMQRFPNHFHDYYVIGFIERGTRALSVGAKEYETGPGDLLLFNPLDTHTCAQIDGDVLDYRCLNVPLETMRAMALEITGLDAAPKFSINVVARCAQIGLLRELHTLIMENGDALEKEELFFFLLEVLIREYAGVEESGEARAESAIAGVRALIEADCTRSLTLAELCESSGLNKFHMLRLFTKTYGITPYRYLETVRVNRAKELLKEGALPVDAALQSGFSDQSHFSNFFKRFIGLTPGQYRDIFTEKD